MKKFAFINVATRAAALDALKPRDGSLLERIGSKRALGGGSDLLGEMKDRIAQPDAVVNLKRIGDLHGIGYEKSVLKIGATTTLTEVAAHEIVQRDYAALAQAADHVGSPQIRHVATVAGNLAQRPRCWYFRDSEIACLKKGGDTCPAVGGRNKYHAIFGNEAPCHIVALTNLGVALHVLGGKICIASPSGERSVTPEEFFRMPTADDPYRETTLEPGEFITCIMLGPAGMRSAYAQIAEKDEFDWALASAAAAVQIDGFTISEVRLALGAVAPVPWRLRAVEEYLRGKPLNDQTLNEAADLAVAEARPMSENGYKIPIAKAVLKRALRAAAQI